MDQTRPLANELREVSGTELARVLDAHRRWLTTDGREGQKADLSKANLQNADLPGVDLHKADLLKANLQGANLLEANLLEADLRTADLRNIILQKATLWKALLLNADLREADLHGANLQEADLRGAKLWRADLSRANLSGVNLLGASVRDANLQDANLTEVKGLSGRQLGGANVSGANLPEPVAEFEGLKVVEAASKNAQKLFTSVLLGCLYSVLTIATTTDIGLLTNSAASPLPIIGTPIPIVGFYWIAPLLLLCLYFYFHVYMQRIWDGLAGLPAVFPDGRALHERAYPWLLNGLVHAYFVRLITNRPPLARLQVGISILLAWWVVPTTLVLFWIRYLPRRDWYGTAVHVVVLVISVVAAIHLHRLARATLRGAERKPLSWSEALKDAGVYKLGVLGLVVMIVLSFVCFGAIEGIPPHVYEDPTAHQPPDLKVTDIRRLVPLAFTLVGYSPFADLREIDVSTKPAGWSGEESEIRLVKGGRLRGANLRYVQASRVFLVNADLREGNLEGADLREADLRASQLQKVKLERANLVRAKLEGSDLRGADLRRANLSGSSLFSANLQSASMQQADLTGANLQAANLKGADLRSAKLAGARLNHLQLKADLEAANLLETDLMGADMIGVTGLTASQVKAAKNWMLAFYRFPFLAELGLPSDHNTAVKRKLIELKWPGPLP